VGQTVRWPGERSARCKDAGVWRQTEWKREQSDVLKVDSFGEA